MPYLHLPCRRGREAEANPTQTQTTELDTGDMEREVLASLTHCCEEVSGGEHNKGQWHLYGEL